MNRFIEREAKRAEERAARAYRLNHHFLLKTGELSFRELMDAATAAGRAAYFQTIRAAGERPTRGAA